ncbi:DUF6907 domain-containing protein [Streptomyces antarcticus]|uniref:DUF6907 domain-containing protein n=1 Tax=Streptomyces antarcticus TaxID=2996458 RepID=UPI0022AF1377|nr:hypothetical protein [Streptomyces sp. H34-S5]MCZ4083534.1 hypothetical protein [Streptomyces sp. H34-S5]
MTGARTATVPTIDHGPITITCPAWCTGHDGQVPEYRADLNHRGPEHAFNFDGQQVFLALLTQYPFGSGRRETGLYVEETGFARTLDPAGLRQLAATLTVHAVHLRTLAGQLDPLLAGGGS